MKVCRFIVILLLPLCLGLTSGNEPPAKENKYVKMEVSLARDTVRVGSKGTMLITLLPIDGIHVNADPAVGIMLEKNRFIALDGDPEMSVDKETGFLDTTDPVEQRLTFSSRIAPGVHALKGTIVYYFCSDARGWCTKFVQPFSLQVNVTK